MFVSTTRSGTGAADTGTGSDLASSDSVIGASVGGLVSVGVSFSRAGGSGVGGSMVSAAGSFAWVMFASVSGADCVTGLRASCTGSLGSGSGSGASGTGSVGFGSGTASGSGSGSGTGVEVDFESDCGVAVGSDSAVGVVTEFGPGAGAELGSDIVSFRASDWVGCSGTGNGSILSS